MSEIFMELRIKEMLKGNLKRYLLFGLIEIFLVVAGILIALAINNWDLKKTLRSDELKIYQAIRERILEDKKIILDDMEYNNTYLGQFRWADSMISENNKSVQDSLFQIVPNLFNYSDFDKSSFIYQNLENSGELKLLRNSDITSMLQELEESYFYMNRMENIHWQVILEIISKDILNNFDLSSHNSPNPELLFSFQFHNQILLLIRIMEEKKEVYQRTLQQINELNTLITREFRK